MTVLEMDRLRYRNSGEKMPAFQYWMRKTQMCRFPPLKIVYKTLFVIFRNRRLLDLSVDTDIGGGLYFGHPSCISVNYHAVIGNNVNINKCVTIGKENRGIRKGTPTIGNNVWIGTGAVIVGKIRIGNDVLIAPNSYVNQDVPDHSLVLGNPCVIKPKENATADYICSPAPLGQQ